MLMELSLFDKGWSYAFVRSSTFQLGVLRLPLVILNECLLLLRDRLFGLLYLSL